MSERFQRLYKLPDNLYAKNSPVIVSAGALLKDVVTDNIVVQLKFRSVSSHVINAVKVSISAYDISGIEIEGIDDYQYLDLSIYNGQEFGVNKAIIMPNIVTRSFKISALTVIFAKGNVCNVTLPLIQLPQCKSLQTDLFDRELIKQYQLATSEKSTYAPQEFDNLWGCSCGEWNQNDKCTKCKLSKQLVFAAFDVKELKIKAETRIASEKAQQEEARIKREAQKKVEEEERQEKEKKEAIQRKKKKKIINNVKKTFFITIPIIVLILIFTCIVHPYVIKPYKLYADATEMLAEKQFDSAANIFENLGAFKNSTEMLAECKYQKAETLYSEKKYTEAAQIYSSIYEYKDSKEKVLEIYDVVCTSVYAEAENLLSKGDNIGAAFAFGQLLDYKDSLNRAQELWNNIVFNCTFSTTGDNAISIKENGEIATYGLSKDDQNYVKTWTDVISVSAGDSHSVGLCSNGTVVATGKQNSDVNGWTNIVAISAGGFHTVGIKSDGTVVATGRNIEGQCNVEDWENIIAVSAGKYHTVGLKSDGTVIAIGLNDKGQCRVEEWQNIIAISASEHHTVGLCADGTVVAVGRNYNSECDVDDWKDIISIHAGRYRTVGLKKDGTVIFVGYDHEKFAKIEKWKDIISISLTDDSVVGVTSGGYLVQAGTYRAYSDFECIFITEQMKNSIESLASEITGIDFGENGFLEYSFNVDNIENKDITNNLKIYKNGAIALRQDEFRQTHFLLSEDEDIATWDFQSKSFSVDINENVRIKITIIDDGALIETIKGECTCVVDGIYSKIDIQS